MPAAAIENHHLPGIDEVRIADLVAVQAPDFRPAPWLLEELAGDVPQRVALDDDVTVGRIVGEREGFAAWRDGDRRLRN
ncbi:MAG: hypothetical protein MZW92_76810 [Comamonadaceae bacterium]|nr:hypothetical protein [Comamonadaceae bacterium]